MTKTQVYLSVWQAAVVILTVAILAIVIVGLTQLSLWISKPKQAKKQQGSADGRGRYPNQNQPSVRAITAQFKALRSELSTRHRQQEDHESRRHSLEKIGAFAAILAAILAGISAWIFQGQLNEARDEQRPWLFAQSIGLADPVTHDANGIRVSLAFVVTNSGHLPGSYVTVGLHAFPFPLGNLKEYASVERQVCDRTIDFLGISVFPNYTTPPWTWITYVENADIAKYAASNPNLAKMIMPTIIACVIYRDPAGKDHHTPYVLNLAVIRDGHACCAVPVDPDELSRSQIIARQIIEMGIPPD